MSSSDIPTIDQLVELARPVVVRVLRRRFHGASLSPSDERRENERAIDCFQQTMLELCAKFRRVLDEIDPPILSVPDYAARVAHNVVNEEVRPPNWTRLANRVRRVISVEVAFDTWDDQELGQVAGFAGWRAQRQPSGTVPQVRQAMSALRSDAVLATRWDNMGAPDWRTLLERVFDAAGGPLRLSALVLLLTEILDIASEVPWDDTVLDEEALTTGDRVQAPSPEHSMIVKEQLMHLWACARELRREWRLAFLLNPPSTGEPRRANDSASTADQALPPHSRPRTSGRGTSRGELDVLPAHGVATVAEIGEALELTSSDCRLMGDALGVDAADFDGLWHHLPVPDSVIGRMLGKTGMQVLALRKLAIRQVATCMVERAGPSGHIASVLSSVRKQAP